jgi:hypothetical protein
MVRKLPGPTFHGRMDETIAQVQSWYGNSGIPLTKCKSKIDFRMRLTTASVVVNNQVRPRGYTPTN